MKLKIFFTLLVFLLASEKISFAQNIESITVNLNDKQSCRNYISVVCEETVKLLSQKELPPAPNYNLLCEAVERLSGGKNIVLLDDAGYPSIMVKINQFCDFNENVHPMFKVLGKTYPCVYIGKYESSVYHGRAYSLPNVDPATMMNIAQARELCKTKGRGWHVTTNIEYAGISYICYVQNFYPHGNTNTDINENFYKNENGRITLEKRNDNGKILIRRTATGSGPVIWAHDGTENGIYDLNGNIWETADGVRMVKGELQLIPDNNAALYECWEDWCAVAENGKLTKIGASKTWKFDSTKSDSESTFHHSEGAIPFLSLTRENSLYEPEDTNKNFGFGTCKFSEVTSTKKVPALLKIHMLFPSKLEDFTDSRIWLRNYGTRRILRGGMWGHSTGIFGYSFAATWEDTSPGMGFRLSYIDLSEEV